MTAAPRMVLALGFSLGVLAEWAALRRPAFAIPAGSAERWLAVADFVPISPTGRALDPSVAASLLIVVDLVNSLPGARGRIVLHQLSLGRVE